MKNQHSPSRCTQWHELSFSYRAAVETNLELLQRQQKELEQENKKKKALLEQTLRERYRYMIFRPLFREVSSSK